MPEGINADMTRRVVLRSATLPWSASPAAGVWRKRLHHVGSAEAGQVTSIVRFDAGARFPAHDHPQGEEILVLEGVFSDEQGDWPAGTLLLNPEGFRHSPHSASGCVLLVRLRQYAGAGRAQLAVQTGDLPWQDSAWPGIATRLLYHQPGFAERMEMQRWAPGTRPDSIAYPGGAELFVLTGSLADEAGSYPMGSWLRLPAGASHHPQTDAGCTLYLRHGLPAAPAD